MANRLTQTRAAFEKRITDAEEFADKCVSARHPSFERKALVVQHVEWAHEAAAIKVSIAAERFLEVALGLYVLGERTASGYRPRRRHRLDMPLSEVLTMFRGDQAFIGWNNPEEVVRRAERWLVDGRPFVHLLSASQLLSYIRKMRNAMAHDSHSANDVYMKATRGLYGATPRRSAPGARLIGPPPPAIPYLTGPSLFKATLTTYRLLAQQLVP